MDTREVLDLPTFNNSPLMLIKLTPGIEASNNRRYNGVNALGGTNEAHNVGAVGGGDWSIDGVPDMGNGYAAAYLPYSTTISEYKVATENFDAAVGHSSGMADRDHDEVRVERIPWRPHRAVLEQSVERRALLREAGALSLDRGRVRRGQPGARQPDRRAAPSIPRGTPTLTPRRSAGR